MTVFIVVKHPNYVIFCGHKALEPCHFLPPPSTRSMTVSIVVKHLNHDTFCHHQALEPCHFLLPSCACGSLGGQKLSATGQHSGRHLQPISELEDRAHTPPADPRRPQHPPPASLVSRALDAASARIRGPRTRLDSPFGIVN